jgi:hypothetical protein
MATEKMAAWTKVIDGAPILKVEMLNKLYRMLSDGWTATVVIEDDGLRIEYERTVPDPEPTLSSQLQEVYDYLSNLLLRPAAVAEQKKYRAILQKAIDEVESLEARVADTPSISTVAEYELLLETAEDEKSELEARIVKWKAECDEWKRKYENHPNVCAICYHHFDEDTPPADTGKQVEPTPPLSTGVGRTPTTHD